MPKDLAALLVEDGAIPADVVERALARQQEAGGTLDTALLELSPIPEDVLASYLARAAELPHAPAAAWKAADPRARRVFPSRVAERHGLAPFALDGRELSLVATYPVDLGLLDEISFMLSLHLTAHVGPEWRVRELIHRIYGSPLAPRLAAIAERVQGGAGAPAQDDSPPPQAEEPEPMVRAELVAELEPEAPPAPAERRPPPPGFGGFGGDDEPMEPLAAALAEALESVDFSDFEDDEPAPTAPGASGAAPPPEEELASEEPEPEEPRAPADRTAPPHWKLEDARAAVAASHHRDDVVLAALRYARDFFEFAAMFAVTRDAVAGHDALGIEEARERVRAVAIWADDPGVFRTVIETQSPYLGPVQAGAAGTDAVLHGLTRSPRTVLVYPIVLRARPVCILYADNGEAPVSARRLGDLLLFLSTVGPAFERIIRARKKRRPRRAAPAPAPVPDEPPPAPAAEAAPTAEAAPGAPAPSPAGEEPLPVLEAVEEVPEAPRPAEGAAPGAGSLEAAALPPEPEAAPAAVESAPAPPPADEEGELSFASLEAAGQVEPEPAPAPPPAPRRAPLPTDPGRTAILWPAAKAPEVAPPAGEGEADPWAAAQQAAKTAPSAPARSGGSADSLDALEDRFFAGGEEPAAPAEAAAPPQQPAAPAPVPVPPRAAEAKPAPPAAPPAPAAEAPAPAAPRADEQAPRARPVEPRGAPPVAAPPDLASLAALADRALDSDPDAAAAACAGLGNRRRDPAMRTAAEKLRRALLSGLAVRAARAARAIGALRDQEAIPLLIQVLETSDPETAKAAADALAAITLQRLGPDARRWLAWWKENRGRGRAEWLFSALTSPDRELRVAASLELSHAAPPPVAYTADMPAPDREKAARAWAGWWSRSGHVL